MRVSLQYKNTVVASGRKREEFFRQRGCCFMVTFGDLIAYTVMIATIVKIVYDITKKH